MAPLRKRRSYVWNIFELLFILAIFLLGIMTALVFEEQLSDVQEGLMYLLFRLKNFISFLRPNLTKSLFDEINNYKGCGIPVNVSQCDRVVFSPNEKSDWFVKNYLAPRWPVVISFKKDNFKDIGWNTHKWTSKYLAAKLAGIDQIFEVKNNSNQLYGTDTMKEKKSMSTFFAEVWQSKKYNNSLQWYLNLQDKSNLLSEALLQLSSDFHIPSFFMYQRVFDINLWMGRSDDAVGSKSELHFDGNDNLYAIIEGSKEFYLYSPYDGFNLYIDSSLKTISDNGNPIFEPDYSFEDRHTNFSPVKDYDDEVMLEKYPRARNARRMRCKLRKGEMLYIPTGWWHQVSSFGKTIALNFWSEPAIQTDLRYQPKNCEIPTQEVSMR